MEKILFPLILAFALTPSAFAKIDTVTDNYINISAERYEELTRGLSVQLFQKAAHICSGDYTVMRTQYTALHHQMLSSIFTKTEKKLQLNPKPQTI